MREFTTRDLINYGRYKHVKKHIVERIEQLYDLYLVSEDEKLKERVMWEIEALERRLEKYTYI